MPESSTTHQSNPHTPTAVALITTPSLGSPDSPQIGDPTIQTPGSTGKPRLPRPAGDVTAKKASGELGKEQGMTVDNEQDEGVGLGYGQISATTINKGGGLRLGAAGGSELTRGDVVVGGKDDDALDVAEFPDLERLKAMKSRVAEIQGSANIGGERDELLRMVSSLLSPTLDSLPFMQQQLEAQRDTIKTLQAQARLSKRLITADRERQIAERQSWQTTIQALTRQRETEIAAGIRPRRLLDLDVGYHQELEAANKRLEMDNRLMAPRRQIDKLVTELKYLRSHVVLSSDPFAAIPSSLETLHPPLATGESPNLSRDIAIDPSLANLTNVPAPSAPTMLPPSINRKHPRSRSPAKPGNPATMGDARTEHLLLAARKVRAMRAHDERVGRLTLEELRKGGVVGPDGGLGYSEGYGGMLEGSEVDVDDEESEVDEKPEVGRRQSYSGFNGLSNSSGKGKGKLTNTPGASKHRKSQSMGKAPPKTPLTTKAIRAPLTTPGGSNFSDLLRAAELATRPGTPEPASSELGDPIKGGGANMATMSATRSTTRGRDARAKRRAGRTEDELDEVDSDEEEASPSAKKVKRSDGSWVRARRLGSMSAPDAPGESHASRVRKDNQRGGVLLGLTPDIEDIQSDAGSVGVAASKSKNSRAQAGGDNSALDLLFEASQIDSPTSQPDAQQGQGDPGLEAIAEEGSPTRRKGGAGQGGLAPALEIRQNPLSASPISRSIQPSQTNVIDPELQTRQTSTIEASPRTTSQPILAQYPGQFTAISSQTVTNPPNTQSNTGTSIGIGVAAGLSTPKSRARNMSTSSASDLKEVQTPARNWTAFYQDSPFDETPRSGYGYNDTPLVSIGAGGSTFATPNNRNNNRGGFGGSTSVPATLAHGVAGTGLGSTGFGNSMGGAGGAPSGDGRGGSTTNGAGPNAFNSPTGATVPGLGKYVHLTNTMPARRVRSPYLKWTSEEDELLARAVAIHGEKWDLVSKGVPTRSYHQVRQRWLRKTGAFDKKPGAAELAAATARFTSGLNEVTVDPDQNPGDIGGEGATSPTPAPGGNRKRKMSLA